MSKQKPMRQWAAPSYDATTGRANVSSGRDSSPHCSAGDRQIPQHALDKKMGEASKSQRAEAVRQKSRPGFK